MSRLSQGLFRDCVQFCSRLVDLVVCVGRHGGDLLAIQMHQDYMATPLMQGLGKIYQALMALRRDLPPALSARISPVRDRATQLYGLVQSRSSR
jgi:hypothetical protein